MRSWERTIFGLYSASTPNFYFMHTWKKTWSYYVDKRRLSCKHYTYPECWLHTKKWTRKFCLGLLTWLYDVINVLNLKSLEAFTSMTNQSSLKCRTIKKYNFKEHILSSRIIWESNIVISHCCSRSVFWHKSFWQCKYEWNVFKLYV